MARRVTGYINGKAIWEDIGPSYGGSVKLGGSLVVGRVGEVEAQRLRSKAHKRGHTTPRGCGLDGRCQHPPCTSARADEAARLYYSSKLTLAAIGAVLGGRNHRTIRYLIGIAGREEAA